MRHRRAGFLREITGGRDDWTLSADGRPETLRSEADCALAEGAGKFHAGPEPMRKRL